MLRIAAIALALAAAPPASGHDWAGGGAGWIEKHHRECCGPEDCRPVDPEAVRLTPEGWRVDGIPGAIPADAARLSRDRRPWACTRPSDRAGGVALRCLFILGAGV